MKFKPLLAHIIVVLGFLAASFAYTPGVLSGKKMNQVDQIHGKANAQQTLQHYIEHKDWSWWSSSVFSGMPTYQIHVRFENNWPATIGGYINTILPQPINVFFLLMVCFYVFLNALGIKRSLAIIGALAYCFGSYNLIFLEAGHTSKILALAYAPLVLAGLVHAFKGNFSWGLALTALGMGMNLYANHLQITYYLAFIMLGYGIYQFIEHLKSGTIKHFAISSLIAIVGVLIGVATNSSRLMANSEYVKESNRGKSELIEKAKNGNGLDKSYAFEYSYGKAEALTLLVPSAAGGGSYNTPNPKKTETFKAMTGLGVDAAAATDYVKNALPSMLYFGAQGGTAGPAYSGAVIVFLFILGMFIIKSHIKWMLLALVSFFTLIALGKNLESFNYFIFDSIPMFNKFRAMTMILTLVHLLLVWGAIRTLKEITEQNWSFEDIKKPILYSLGIITTIICLGYVGLSFNTENDAALIENLSKSFNSTDAAKTVINAVISDRSSGFWSDTIRTLILALACSALIWAYFSKKIKSNIFIILTGVLLVGDLVLVAKRYFNNDDFVTKSLYATNFEQTAADAEILKDTSPNYRVFNVTTNPFSDARDSYFHKNIGGYHPAKLGRYNDLITKHIANNNMEVLNMLNTKYFVVNGQNGPTVQQNPAALGNAWFVKSVKWVKNADEELNALSKFSPRAEVIIDERFKAIIPSNSFDTTGTIKIVEFRDNYIKYESNAASERLAVFSEIFYRGNTDWVSSIDGVKAEHARGNYVLRAMKVPAGTHTIEFKFDPVVIKKYAKVDLIGSVLMVLLVLGALALEFRKKPTANI